MSTKRTAVSSQNAVILATAIALAMILSSCDRNENRYTPLSGQGEMKTAGITIQERGPS
jgi:hypothetical protein